MTRENDVYFGIFNVSTLTNPVPTPAAGNLLVFLVCCEENDSGTNEVTSIVSDTGTVFQQCPGSLSTSNLNTPSYSSVWYAIAQGNETSVTINLSDDQALLDGMYIEYAADAGKSFVFGTAAGVTNADGSTTTVIGPNITTTVDLSLIVGCASTVSSSYQSIANPYTFTSSDLDEEFDGEGAAEFLSAGPGTYSATWTVFTGASAQNPSSSFAAFSQVSSPPPSSGVKVSSVIATGATDILTSVPNFMGTVHIFGSRIH